MNFAAFFKFWFPFFTTAANSLTCCANEAIDMFGSKFGMGGSGFQFTIPAGMGGGWGCGGAVAGIGVLYGLEATAAIVAATLPVGTMPI